MNAELAAVAVNAVATDANENTIAMHAKLGPRMFVVEINNNIEIRSKQTESVFPPNLHKTGEIFFKKAAGFLARPAGRVLSQNRRAWEVNGNTNHLQEGFDAIIIIKYFKLLIFFY